MNSNLSVAALLSQVSPLFTGEMIFDQFPDIVYFIKNQQGAYLVVNNTLVERCGLRSKQQLIGKAPSQVLRAPYGQSYEQQDQQVLRSGHPLIGKLELQIYPSRDVGWCLTHKLPLLDSHGTVIGLIGVSQDLRIPDAGSDEYQHLSAAVNYARAHLDSPPSVKDLADIAEMSTYQLDRRMRLVFGLTTGQWLLKQRIDQARELLRSRADSISSIALQVGYLDKSAFTRQFRKATGLSPSDYRTATVVPVT